MSLTPEERKDKVAELNPDALFADNFEDALVGIAECWHPTRDGNGAYHLEVAAYDWDKCIEILEEDMDRDEAVEHMSFNVTGGYLGENTPIFIRLFDA